MNKLSLGAVAFVMSISLPIPLVAEEGSEDGAQRSPEKPAVVIQKTVKTPARNKRISFDTKNEKPLASHRDVEKWANKELKKRAGLGEQDELSVSRTKHTYKHGESYRVQQTHRGIPVEQLGGVITLDVQGRPTKTKGKMTELDYKGSMSPTITMRQALAIAGHVEDTPNAGELIFWLDSSDEPILSYKLSGKFSDAGQILNQIVIVDALKAEVMTRISNEFSIAAK